MFFVVFFVSFITGFYVTWYLINRFDPVMRMYKEALRENEKLKMKFIMLNKEHE